MKTFKLRILTPKGLYLESDVAFLSIRSEESTLGILPDHTPLVSTIDICIGRITFSEKEYRYAIGGGVLNVEKDKVTLILNSIEREDEIDRARAIQSKQRAEKRIKEGGSAGDFDVLRAELALKRAINRIALVDKTI